MQTYNLTSPRPLLNTTYDRDCHGTMKSGDNRTCNITNTPFMGLISKSRLTIVTNVTNHCHQKESCSTAIPGWFSEHIYTFEDGLYKEKGTWFPGTASGWMTTFPQSPEGIQYNIEQKQKINELFINGIVLRDIVYSPDCQGTIKNGNNKRCIIYDTISNPNFPK
jgi:hypothetical protein